MLYTNPKNVKEFYPFAIHIIYAVILTLSFETAAEVLVPLDSVLSSYDSIVRSFSLLLVYVFVISGWIGYSKSIGERPHSENWLGNSRFIVDLIIMFLVFYLITLTSPAKSPIFVNNFDKFLWIFPIIFVAYFVWDIFKFFE